MTQRLRPLIAGNWKMHGLRSSLGELEAMIKVRETISAQCDLLICPPATLINSFAVRAAGSAIRIGGQDCHAKVDGPHTGDISAEMLSDAGARAVIVGHSERRASYGEDDAQVCAKVLAAQRAGLMAIVCLGETRAERDDGLTLEVVGRQLDLSLPDRISPDMLVVAYEPVWAIGTGLIPSQRDISEVHAALRQGLMQRFGPGAQAIRLLYGGSVKPDNAQQILSLENVNGALVGGASLKAQDFLAIASAACGV